MTYTRTDDELAAHLRRTLEAVAATVPDEPGDTGVDLVVPLVPVPLTSRGQGRGRLVVAAAAALVVVAAGIVSVVVSDPERTDEATGTRVDSPVADEWLVPSWLPAGTKPWSVTSSGPVDDGTVVWQLFGDPSAGRAVYVELMDYDPDHLPLPPADGEPVTVRGVDGWAAVTSDVAEENPVDSIVWNERGVQLTAKYKGMTQAEALAAVEGLEARSASRTEGFDPPADGWLPLVGEAGPTGPSTQLLYSDGVPTSDSPALSILTTAAGGSSLGYLDAWFYEGGDATSDGSAPVYRTGSESLLASWPDGRTVHIYSLNGDPVDEATLQRIADSAATVDDSSLEGLKAAAAANVESLPTLASESLSVTYELHGEGDFRRICLRLPDATELDCGELAHQPGDYAANSWLVDGTWHVAVATTTAGTSLFGDRGESYRDDPLDTGYSTGADLKFITLVPPDDVDEVFYDTTSDGTGSMISIPRPT